MQKSPIIKDTYTPVELKNQWIIQMRINNLFSNSLMSNNKIILYYNKNRFNTNFINTFLAHKKSFPDTFVLKDTVGTGKFGVIKKICLDLKNDCDYVVKIVKFKEKFDEEYTVKHNILTFIDEVDLLVKCKDWDKTAQIEMAYLEGDRGYIILKNIEGMNLYYHLLDIKYKHPSDYIVYMMPLFIQCYRILLELYTKYNIIHGDCHLNNFLITKSNKIYLIDFGLAILSDESNIRCTARSTRLCQIANSKKFCYDIALFTTTLFTLLDIDKSNLLNSVINKTTIQTRDKYGETNEQILNHFLGLLSKFKTETKEKDKTNHFCLLIRYLLEVPNNHPLWSHSFIESLWNYCEHYYNSTKNIAIVTLLDIRSSIYNLYINKKQLFLKHISLDFFKQMFCKPFNMYTLFMTLLHESKVEPSLEKAIQCMHKIMPYMIVFEAEAFEKIAVNTTNIKNLKQPYEF